MTLNFQFQRQYRREGVEYLSLLFSHMAYPSYLSRLPRWARHKRAWAPIRHKSAHISGDSAMAVIDAIDETDSMDSIGVAASRPVYEAGHGGWYVWCIWRFPKTVSVKLHWPSENAESRSNGERRGASVPRVFRSRTRSLGGASQVLLGTAKNSRHIRSIAILVIHKKRSRANPPRLPYHLNYVLKYVPGCVIVHLSRLAAAGLRACDAMKSGLKRSRTAIRFCICFIIHRPSIGGYCSYCCCCGGTVGT